jgi:branched-chain amino acid transport system ATP-binding protein
MLLRVERVSAAYGRVAAIRDLSLAVEKGAIAALVGANGAGKTSLLRVLSGLLQPASGRVVFDGQDITAMRAARRVAAGVAQVPEGRQIFASLSVDDNLNLGGYARSRALLRAGLERVFALFPVLRERRHAAAGSLSGGEQQMLAFGRALMSEPKLLLLDEPSLGLSPMMTDEIFGQIAAMNRAGMSILLVEQNAAKALALAHTAYVMESGALVKSGRSADVANDPAVRSAYLGL